MIQFLATAASAIQSSGDKLTGSVTALSLGGKDVLSARALEATGSSVLPLEVVLILIGAMLVSGFALLLRETRIERKSSSDH
ncbi:hypothetical protein [Henriciella marina]|uniref:hypothetical protein n=1 Tax=Henriciella marina TaxID=453851 RepID=UPI00035FA6F5|nr:hypothetical protein [Henriciella marina]